MSSMAVGAWSKAMEARFAVGKYFPGTHKDLVNQKCRTESISLDTYHQEVPRLLYNHRKRRRPIKDKCNWVSMSRAGLTLIELI